MGRYLQDRDDLQAEALFERFIGYAYAKKLITEVHQFNKKYGYQVQLKEEPIEVVEVRGFIKYPELKFENWAVIPIKAVYQQGRVLHIPPSIFGVPFQKVEVRYYGGTEDIPEDIREAVSELSEHLAKENINEWNIPLSPKSLTTIAKYRR